MSEHCGATNGPEFVCSLPAGHDTVNHRAVVGTEGEYSVVTWSDELLALWASIQAAHAAGRHDEVRDALDVLSGGALQ